MVLETNIAEIAGILKREIRSFETILELLILEEKFLIDCDVNSLAGILERQEDVFSSIACLEKSRTEILEKIAEEMNVDADKISISFLKEHVGGDIRQELTETGHVLSRLNEDIQRKKAGNTMLINQSIMLVESDIRIILSSLNRNDSDPAYNADAETGMTSQGVCIDQRL